MDYPRINLKLPTKEELANNMENTELSSLVLEDDSSAEENLLGYRRHSEVVQRPANKIHDENNQQSFTRDRIFSYGQSVQQLIKETPKLKKIVNERIGSVDNFLNNLENNETGLLMCLELMHIFCLQYQFSPKNSKKESKTYKVCKNGNQQHKKLTKKNRQFASKISSEKKYYY